MAVNVRVLDTAGNGLVGVYVDGVEYAPGSELIVTDEQYETLTTPARPQVERIYPKPDSKQDPFVFDVDDYGADPLGNLSSTAAVQQAINLAIAQGGGIVRFGPGTFLLGSVWATDAITFEGSGVNSTVIVSDNIGAEYGYIWYDQGVTQPSPDDVIEGATSGARAIVIAVDNESGSFPSTATGRLYCKTLTVSTFQRNENIDIVDVGTDALRAASVWQAPMFWFAGSKTNGDIAPTMNRTTTGGGVRNMAITANNGLWNGDLAGASRCSSWLKIVPLTNGEQESGGSTPGVRTHYFESQTTNLRGWIHALQDEGGDWGNGVGTGTGSIYIDFVETITATEEASDRNYPGPATALTNGETLNIYSAADRTLVATATAGAQTDACDRDIIGVDFTANGFGQHALLDHVQLNKLHIGAISAQRERDGMIMNYRLEDNTIGVYNMQDHWYIGKGRFENNVFGVSGQNLLDMEIQNVNFTRNLVCFGGYSIRPGIPTVTADRISFTGCSVYGRFYGLLCGNRTLITGTRFIVGEGTTRACVFLVGSEPADHLAGVINGCQFDHFEADIDPAIAYIWCGYGRVTITNNEIKLYGRGTVSTRAGVLIKNTLSHLQGVTFDGNFFNIRGSTVPLKIQLRSDSGEGGGSNFSSYLSTICNNKFHHAEFPSGADEVHTLVVSGGSGEVPEIGDTVLGGTSGETSEIIDIIHWRFGTVGSSNWRGILLVRNVSGAYTGGEAVTWGASGSGTLSASGDITGVPMIAINASAWGNTITGNMFWRSGTSSPGVGLATEDANDYIKFNHFRNGSKMVTIDDSTVRSSYTDNLFA